MLKFLSSRKILDVIRARIFIFLGARKTSQACRLPWALGVSSFKGVVKRNIQDHDNENAENQDDNGNKMNES